MSWVRFLFATALPISIAGQVRPSVPCDAPPALWEEALRASVKVPREKDGKLRSPDEVTQERRERITALYRKYPDDFFVRRAYLTHTKEGVATEEVIAEFRKYADEHPNDTGARFLHAEALTGRRTPEAIRILDELVAKDPANPWPYRLLASIYHSPRFNDRAKMKSNTQAFIDRCPDNKISAGMAMNLDNSPALEKFAERLRARIEGQKDWEMVGTYGSLWRLEFKVTPAARHEEVRERVKRDLKFLESLSPAEFPETSYLREQGYELTADKAARAKMNSEVKTDSQKMPAFFRASEDSHKADPFVPPSAPRKEREAYLRRRLRFLAEWAEKIPDEQFLAAQRVDLMAERADTPAEEIVAEGRRAIRLSREKPAFVFGPMSTISGVALAWAKRGVELDAIPALVKEGEEVSEKRAKANAAYAESDLYASPDDAVHEENSRWSRVTVSWETLALAHFKSGLHDQNRGIRGIAIPDGCRRACTPREADRRRDGDLPGCGSRAVGQPGRPARTRVERAGAHGARDLEGRRWNQRGLANVDCHGASIRQQGRRIEVGADDQDVAGSFRPRSRRKDVDALESEGQDHVAQRVGNVVRALPERVAASAEAPRADQTA